MADFIFKPSANPEGSFDDSVEFEGLEPSETVAISGGIYDIYEKVVSGFSVTGTPAQLDVTDVGEEPMIAATDGNISVTIATGAYAGTYTQRVTDGAPLTVAMIEAAPTPIVAPSVAGMIEQGATLTIAPGLWLYAGADPGDQTWQQQLDGTNISDGTGLTYVIAEVANETTFTVEETFGGVTIESAPLALSFTPSFAGPTDLGAALHTWLDFADPAGMYQDTALTVPVTSDGQSVLGINDKSGNANHYTASALAAGSPEILWNATNSQLETAGQQPAGARKFGLEAVSALQDTSADMEIYIAIKTSDVNWPLLGARASSSSYLGRSHATLTNLPNGNVGAPLLSTNGVDSSITSAKSLGQAWGTDVPLVAGARNINLTAWQSNGYKALLFNCFSDQFPLNPASVTQVVITKALTEAQRADLIEWMEARLPV